MGKSIVIVGAGIGGLTTALELINNGYDVIVLEAHICPGGCAGTFYHKGYRFDAGATLAGGFLPGAPIHWLANYFEIDWIEHLTEVAMQIHLPDSDPITRYVSPESWELERKKFFGKEAESFWIWQERTADALWDLLLMVPPWKPDKLSDWIDLFRIGSKWLCKWGESLDMAGLPGDALGFIEKRLNKVENKLLKLFIDAQLLISAQTTSENANSLFAAGALDLYRQGVGHIEGGMGTIAQKMATRVKQLGGDVIFRRRVTKVVQEPNNRFRIETKQGKVFFADHVIFNLPKIDIYLLLGDDNKINHRLNSSKLLDKGWGAFMLYLGIDETLLPESFPLHHQLVLDETLSEGNSIFVSISPDWDTTRAPDGKRAVTISTHTHLKSWWDAYNANKETYNLKKDIMTKKIISRLEKILPGITNHIDVILPGTPVTFNRFTQRSFGWVGGWPQTSLFVTENARLGQNMWMVGDSIFPGQSVPAVAIGGIRVARALMREEE